MSVYDASRDPRAQGFVRVVYPSGLCYELAYGEREQLHAKASKAWAAIDAPRLAAAAVATMLPHEFTYEGTGIYGEDVTVRLNAISHIAAFDPTAAAMEAADPARNVEP